MLSVTHPCSSLASQQTVAGEGEVKLLEWIYHQPRHGESILLWGGDSDLVLEGLVIPVSSTHNVHVLLPDGNKQFLSVSLWETTKALYRLLPDLKIEHMMKIRSDLVILLILNGNDYLPKLRGSSGFNKLFQAYLHVQRQFRSSTESLVDPDTLEFDLDFCIEFFSYLAATTNESLLARNSRDNGPEPQTALQKVNNFVDAGFIPGPMEFQILNHDQVDSLGEDQEDDDVEDEAQPDIESMGDLEATDGEDGENRILVRLSLGKPGSQEFYEYETWHDKTIPVKFAKQKLAEMAYAELLEEDEDVDEGDFLQGITSSGYAWEIHHAVDSKVDEYLYGILWNLQTYQGTCLPPP
jgi:hypothetical protein